MWPPQCNLLLARVPPQCGAAFVIYHTMPAATPSMTGLGMPLQRNAHPSLPIAVVLLARDTPAAAPGIKDLSIDMSQWQPLIEDRAFVNWLVKVRPGWVQGPRQGARQGAKAGVWGPLKPGPPSVWCLFGG